ncbi:MAG: hypothetical protein RMJ38_07695, partial [candidate division WOR-3 bacterium]|nr:hypothetical protein [candidate division WOR-3 bacterium]MDW8151302.1 hypothetical protein [candidate division WOR-3 bacterium]
KNINFAEILIEVMNKYRQRIKFPIMLDIYFVLPFGDIEFINASNSLLQFVPNFNISPDEIIFPKDNFIISSSNRISRIYVPEVLINKVHKIEWNFISKPIVDYEFKIKYYNVDKNQEEVADFSKFLEYVVKLAQ